jgi:hypothetical protein
VDRPILAVAADAGGGPRVDVVDASSGSRLFSFFAFNPLFTGGASVATADFNGDGFTDIIVGAGPGGGPTVFIFSGFDGEVIGSVFAYNPFFSGGVNVAVGDVNGDGQFDIITGAGPGAGPHVKVFSSTPAGLMESASFFAYPSVLTSGVLVAVGDLNGDRRAEIITGPSIGPPHVKAFTGTGDLIHSFYGFHPSLTGVSVAAGDTDGDGRAEIILGAGPGGGPAVLILDGETLAERGGLYPFSMSFLGGVRVAVGSGPGGGLILYAGTGPGGPGLVRRVDLSTLEFLPDDLIVVDMGMVGLRLGTG